MWLHYTIFGTLVLLSALFGARVERGAQKSKVVLVAAFVFFVGFAALRDVTIGNDTIDYRRVFREVARTDSLSEAWEISRFEPGYVAVNYLVSRVTDNFNVLLLVVAVFSFGAVTLFIQKYARSNSVAVLMAFGMSVYYVTMMAARQGMAVAVFLLAFPALIRRQPVRYVLLVLLAAQFHTSAYLLLVIYFISRITVNTFGDALKWGLLVGVGLLSLNSLLAVVADSSAYYGHYLESSYAAGGVRMATIMILTVRLIMIALASTCGWRAAIEEDATEVTRYLLTLVIVDVAVVIVSLGFNLLDRFEMYFTLPFVVGLTNIVARETVRRESYVVMLVVLVAFASMTTLLLVRPDWYSLFPYRIVPGAWDW